VFAPANAVLTVNVSEPDIFKEPEICKSFAVFLLEPAVENIPSPPPPPPEANEADVNVPPPTLIFEASTVPNEPVETDEPLILLEPPP